MNDENREVDFAALGNGRVTSAVLEGVHLRKYFPVRQFKLVGPRNVVHAVEDTSLALYPGRALALVGESGSGKTTVARILARLHEPTAGTILFHGEPEKSRSDLKDYRRHVQIVFQDPFSSLNAVHDVRYHLKRPLRIHGHAHTSAQETEQVLDMLNLLLRLKDEEQLALLFITHDIASARYFAEETLVMYAGQTVEGGSSEEVIQ